MRVTQNGCVEKVEIVADGVGLVSRSGTALIAGLSDRLGLTSALSEAFADTRERTGGHDRGRVLRDLALTLADGGDCLSDLGALREQPELFGSVASAPTDWRAVAAEEGGLERIRGARAAMRERAWAAGGAPREIVLDFDSHLVTSHSEKQGATPTWKRGFWLPPAALLPRRLRRALGRGVARGPRRGQHRGRPRRGLGTRSRADPRGAPRPSNAGAL